MWFLYASHTRSTRSQFVRVLDQIFCQSVVFWSENLTRTVVRNRRLTETKNLFTLIYYFRVGQIF